MRIENVDVWNGEQLLSGVDLEWFVEGADATIARVEASKRVDAPGTRLGVIPGLIDTHVHLIGYAGTGHTDFLSWPVTTRPEEQVLHGLANARTALRAGVTTLRDLSADDIQFSLARALNAGIVEGPRLLAYGMVSMTAGHGDLFTPPAVTQRRPTADGADACRKLVRQWARAGADGIKIATSGGVLSVGDKASWRNHTREELDAIVDEAHALSLPVAAHAHTAEGIGIALDVGADSIEHGTLVTAEQSRSIAASGVSIAPTILINDRIASGARAVSPEQSAKAAELVSQRDALFRGAVDAGVDFVLGTDANGHHVAFGDQMEEIRAMAKLFEWDAARALASATTRAASVIGRADSLGRLTVGYTADFVVMRGRPWEDLVDLDVSRIVAVVSRGRVVAGSLPMRRDLRPGTASSPRCEV
ncbi:metal-dependent hydrolase family protein [Microbacterium sp.]|uniref:metal-dependent hydrolase family protein n=1 Tax=Microbacterium sp. TaxID=51671 RepID=UPI003C715C95